MNRYLWMCIILIVGLASGTAWGDFVGTWVNIDPSSGGLAEVDIGSQFLGYTVHPWGKCTPTLCDWGVKGVSIFGISGDHFTLMWDFGFKQVTITYTLVSEMSLWAHEVNHFVPSGVGDYTLDDYFQRQGTGPALPDLQITSVTIPKPVVVYQETPWTWVTATIRNQGPGILNSGAITAIFEQCTLNGAPLAHSGYLPFAYTAPLKPGQEITHDFAVGTTSGWPVGQHTIRLHVNADNSIAEADTTNNVSDPLSFDIALRQYLAGTVTYNHVPLSTFTSVSPSDWWVENTVTSGLMAGYTVSYNPQTGHYLFSWLQHAPAFVYLLFPAGGPGGGAAGNYTVGQSVDLTALSDAAASNVELPAVMNIHMTQPWDNANIAPSNTMTNCVPFRAAWDPVPGAVNYHVWIDKYRDPANPGGYGFISNMVDLTTTNPWYDAVLDPSAALEHYQLYVEARNSLSQTIASLVFSSTSAFGGDYRFKVCGTCLIADINRDCSVNMQDLALLASQWLLNVPTN
jgi:hypothetical protein